ncbi:MAG: hypothetical protein ACYS8W_13725 [Planctomycetota bacterium]|jgi:hypothetical protein
MLSLFTVPKPFHGILDVIQKNAIRSWTLLRPACRIILLGDEDGTAEAAASLGVHHIPAIRKNEYGTPFLDSIAEEALKASRNRLIGYINADIILLQDFMDALIRIARRRPFLMIGERWDLDVKSSLDFSDDGWQRKIRELALREGRLHGKTGIDYFITRRRFWHNIPPFAIGRTVWDNHLVYKARKEGFDVVDATPVTTVVHQNHHFEHVKTNGGPRRGPEADYNLQTAGGWNHLFSVQDSTHSIGRAFVVPAIGERYSQRLVGNSLELNTVNALFPRYANALIRFLGGKFNTLNKSD